MNEAASSWHLLAGAMARITTAFVMMPLDTIKTRLQFQGQLEHVRRYRSVADAGRTILREEGVRGLWRGVGVKLLYKAPAGAVSFGCYELFRRVLTRPQAFATDYGRLSLENPLVPLLLGATARILGTASRTPFDVVKQRLQVHGQQMLPTRVAGLGALSAARSGGLFAGLGVTLLRDMPFGTLYFASYEGLRHVLLPLSGLGVPSSALFLTAGGGAGLLATIFTIPFDVVKTRVQTQAALPPAQRRYTSAWRSLRIIWLEEGARGLATGLSARLFYLMPATAITFASYEQFKSWFGVT